MKNKKQNKKQNNFKSSRHPFPFIKKKEPGDILLKRVRQKHAFEDIQKTKDNNEELGQIWDEDLCE